MSFARGCELLEQRLDELLERTGAARDEVLRVRRSSTLDADDPVAVAFGRAATYVAGTLSDVSERLERLRELLVILDEKG